MTTVIPSRNVWRFYDVEKEQDERTQVYVAWRINRTRQYVVIKRNSLDETYFQDQYRCTPVMSILSGKFTTFLDACSPLRALAILRDWRSHLA